MPGIAVHHGRNAQYRLLSRVLDWGTPLMALTGTVLAALGDPWKWATTTIGAVVTCMGALNLKIRPRDEAATALTGQNAYAAFKDKVDGQLERITQQHRGKWVEQHESAELEHVNGLQAELDALRQAHG